MVSLKIRPWDPIDGLEHTSTSWRIATDIDMTNILEEITDSTIWLTLWYSNITIPASVTYYAQAQRTLSDGTVLPWTEPIPVRNHNNSTSVLLHTEVKIATPIVNIGGDETNLIASTGEAKLTAESHFATHWIIRNANKEVIFVSLYDETNLTSLTVSKALLDYDNLAGIYVEAIHLTATGIESKIGSTYKDILSTNFEITTNLKYVEPYTDLVLRFSKIDPTLPIGITKINLKPMYGDTVLYTQTFSSEVSIVTIPKNLLLPDREYVIELYVRINEKNEIVRYYMNTNDYSTRTQFIDNDKVYENKIIPRKSEPFYKIIPYSSLYETFDNRIYAPYVDEGTYYGIYEYIYNKDDGEDNISVNRSYVPGISLYDTTESWYGKMLEGNIFLTDNYDNTDDVAMFAVYDYNPFEGSFILKHTIKRINSVPLGYNNAVVSLDKTTIAFLNPDNASSIGFYDVINNTIRYSIESDDFVNNPLINAALVDIGNGRLLVVPGRGSYTTTYIYNISSNTWSQGISIPESFRDHSLRADKLSNGDTIIYRRDKPDNTEDDAVILFSKVKQDFILIDPGTNNLHANDSSIKLNNGDILLISNTYGAVNNGEEAYKHMYV